MGRASDDGASATPGTGSKAGHETKTRQKKGKISFLKNQCLMGCFCCNSNLHFWPKKAVGKTPEQVDDSGETWDADTEWDRGTPAGYVGPLVCSFSASKQVAKVARFIWKRKCRLQQPTGVRFCEQFQNKGCWTRAAVKFCWTCCVAPLVGAESCKAVLQSTEKTFKVSVKGRAAQKKNATMRSLHHFKMLHERVGPLKLCL